MMAPEPVIASVIVAVVKLRVANTSIAASRIRRWMAPVLAQRWVRAEVVIRLDVNGYAALPGEPCIV